MKQAETITIKEEIVVEKGHEMENTKTKWFDLQNLKNKKGFNDLLMALVLLAVVAGLAFAVLPTTMTKVTDISTESNTKLDGLTKIFDNNDGN